MKNKWVKKAIFAIIIVAIIGIGIGIYLYNMPQKNFASSKADFTLTAKELFDEFVKSEQAANAKYVTGNKTIQISGTIKELPESPDTAAIVLIDVQNPDGDISCTLIPEDSKKVKTLKVGNLITVKGQCTGYQELISKEVLMIRTGLIK